MTEQKLLPCPWCGKEPKICLRTKAVYCDSHDCDAMPMVTDLGTGHRPPADIWNTRADNAQRYKDALEDVVESYDLIIKERPDLRGVIGGFFLECNLAKNALKNNP